LERVGIEAGPLSQWLFSGLAATGLPVVSIETRHTKAFLGLSGISCAAGQVNCSIHGRCEALAEEDGELRLGHGPLARRHDPLLFGTVQDQEEEFGRRLVAREMAPGSDRSAQLGI